MSKHIVDIEAEASEASRDMEPPPGVKPTRRARATVFSVRLTDDEYDALAAVAEERGIPVSTLARSLIVQGLDSTRPHTVHDEVVRALRETLRSDVLAS